MQIETLSLEALRLIVRGAVRSCVKDAHLGIVRKTAPANVTKSSEGAYRFVVSTADVDRDNDVIDPQGWELSNYRANPVVLWAHDARALPIGKSKSIGIDNGALVATVEFAPTPFAQEVRGLVDSGFVRGASVGFRPLESTYNSARGGFDFKRCELHEWSVVPVPANPGALTQAKALSLERMDPRALRAIVRELVRVEVRS